MKPTFDSFRTTNNADFDVNKEIMTKLSDFFETLDDEERDNLMQRMTARWYQPSELIYVEGETPRQLFCLLSGKVKIFKEGVGRSQTVRILQAVEYFGYRAAMSQQQFITAASAYEESFIVKFPLALVKKYIQENARLAWFFIQRLATALGRSDERTVSLTQKHLRGRLADSILYLYECYGTQPDGHTLACSLSREDLANLSNMTTNNAIRTLSQFATDGVVTLDGRTIRIESLATLHQISKRG